MRQIKRGSSDISTYVMLVDEVDGSPKTAYAINNLYMQYTVNLSTPSTSTAATALSNANSPHADWKAIEVDSSGSPGLYRVDWEDDAFVSSDQVTLVVKGSGIQPAIETVQLVAADGSDLAAVLEDTIDIQSRIPTVLVGGRIDANAGAISEDAEAANNLEAMLDGTGGVTLSLGQLAIVASGSDNAIIATGSGTGAGIISTGGASGGCGAVFLGDDGAIPSGIAYGMAIHSGEINGGGLSLLGEGIVEPAIKAVANRSDGAQFTSGGSGGSGLKVTGDAGGDGFEVVAGATGAGISVTGGSTSGPAISASATSGAGLLLSGGAAGAGLSALGGSSNGNGIEAGGDNETITATAAGLKVMGGGSPSGHIGLEVLGGATSGDAISASAAGSGEALNNDILNEIGGIVWDTTSASHVSAGTTGKILSDLEAEHTDETLLLQTTIATVATQTSFTLTAGSTVDDTYIGCTIIIRDNINPNSKVVGIVSDYTGSTKTITLSYDPGVFTYSAADIIAIIAAPSKVSGDTQNQLIDAVWNEDLDPAHVTAGTAGKAVLDIESDAAAILLDTQTTIPATLSIIDGEVGNILVDTGTTIPGLLGSPAGASMSADIAAVDTTVDNILLDTAEIGTAGVGLTEAGGTGDHLGDLGGMSTDMKAEITAQAWDATAASHLSAGSTGKILSDLEAEHTDDTVLLRTTIDSYTSNTLFSFVDGSTHDNTYIGCMIIIRDTPSTTGKAVGVIKDYDAATKSVILEYDPGIFTYADGDTITIIAAPNKVSSATREQLVDAVWDEDLDPAHITAGTAGKAVLDIESDATNILTDTGSSIPNSITAVQEDITDILEDTQTTIPATLTTIDGEVGDILTDTGTTIPAALATVDYEVGSMQLNVTSILDDTAEIGVNGAGLTDLGGMSAGMKLEIENEVWSATASSYVSAGTTGKILNDLEAEHTDETVLVRTTIATSVGNNTTFTLTDGSIVDDTYLGCTIIIRDGSDSNSKAVGVISNYTGSTKTVALAYDPGLFTYFPDDTVTIIAAPNKVSDDTRDQLATGIWEETVHSGMAASSAGKRLSDVNNSLPVAPTKNTGLAKFPFLMVSDADHVSPKTGALITPTRSIDGGAFAPCANAGSGLAEIGNGVYTIDLAASDTNGTNIVLRFAATGADDRVIVFVTQSS